jgi:RNA polymerase sigma factor (sigma-70 family)
MSSPFQPDNPCAGASAAADRELTTTSGVRIVVRAPPPPPPPPPEPPRPVDPWNQGTQAIIFPAGQPAHEREAWFRTLCQRYAPFIEKMLILEGILPESAKDLRQDVLVIVFDHVDAKDPILNAKAFLCGVLRNAALNHKRLKRLTARGSADVDEVLSEALDPEEAARLAEEWGKLRRYLGLLSQEEAWLIQRRVFDGAALEEIAAAMGCPRGTVADRVERAKERLAEIAVESERDTRLGLRRGPGAAR